jgi:hypothetical protein
MIVDAVAFGLDVGAGYGLPTSIVNAIAPHAPHPLLYGTVTGAYHTVGPMLVAVILTAWS